MKSQLKKEFYLDLSSPHDSDHYFKVCKSEIVGEIEMTLLADAFHVKVFHDPRNMQFLVVMDGSHWSHHCFPDVYHALLYACLMTASSSLDRFVECFGTVELQEFVCL